MHGVVDILGRIANIFSSMANIYLPKTHFFPFIKIFQIVLDFLKGKNTLSSNKFSKIGLVAVRLMITFRWGGHTEKYSRLLLFYPSLNNFYLYIISQLIEAFNKMIITTK